MIDTAEIESSEIKTSGIKSAGSDTSGLICRRDVEISDALRDSDIHPLLKRVYANRGVTSTEQVDYSLEALLDYRLLKGIESAADIVCRVITGNRRIMVIGDFDADGATSTAVVLKSLHAFGFDNVGYLVPNRFDFGYGLSPQIVDVAAQAELSGQARPDLIITVDNGISSIKGVARANELGIDVVVTDHHLAGDELPEAAAIVNPNQPGCEFPEKSIAGVGVAFYLMLAVRACLREQGWFEQNGRKEPNMAALLDLVALGTVADVVPLEKNNRTLVAAGLKRIRSGRACAGIEALLAVAGKQAAQCTTQDFGFFIGPRLNAAGRLEDMSIGIECLMCEDQQQAMNYAAELNAINLRRREIETDMLDSALASLEQQGHLDDACDAAAVALYDDSWHQGVVGLLASRIKERLHRPVIAFASANEADHSDDCELKGSARSIPGLHIRDVLDVIDKKYQLIEKFGGHAMAAGLTISRRNLEKFTEAFEREVAAVLRPEQLQNIIYTDGSIADEYFDMNVSETLSYAEPWGQMFAEPVFDDVFTVVSWRIVGDRHLKLELVKESSGISLSAIAFNHTDDDLPAGDDRIHAAYRLDVNEYRGNRSLQLIIQKIQPVVEA